MQLDPLAATVLRGCLANLGHGHGLLRGQSLGTDQLYAVRPPCRIVGHTRKGYSGNLLEHVVAVGPGFESQHPQSRKAAFSDRKQMFFTPRMRLLLS